MSLLETVIDSCGGLSLYNARNSCNKIHWTVEVWLPVEMLTFFVPTWQRSWRNACYQYTTKMAGIVYKYVWVGKLLGTLLNPTVPSFNPNVFFAATTCSYFMDKQYACNISKNFKCREIILKCLLGCRLTCRRLCQISQNLWRLH
jgi:hypothetical protein